MGPLLLAGLALAGTAIGIAQITAGARDGTGEDAAPLRATAILAMAFAQGIGLLGSVVGILAIAVFDVGTASAGIVEAVIAGMGAVTGLALVARAWDGLDRRIRVVGLLYVTSSATLGTVIGLLAALLRSGRGIGFDLVFVLLGLVACGTAVTIGRTAARALAATSAMPSAALDIRRRFITSGAIAQATGSIH